MSYPKTPLTAEAVQGVLRELNYVYPLIFCKTLAGKLNAKIADEGCIAEGIALVEKLRDAAGDQPSIATGYLGDILQILKGNPDAQA